MISTHTYTNAQNKGRDFTSMAIATFKDFFFFLASLCFYTEHPEDDATVESGFRVICFILH